MSRFSFMIVEFVVAIGVPALIGFGVSQRWRLWALMLWASSPLLILLALVGRQMASGEAGSADFDKLTYGLLLIGSIAALPWLITCGLGYAAGVALRRRGDVKIVDAACEDQAARSGQQPLPHPYVQPPFDPTAPTLSPPSGWRAEHVGFDHDDVILDGLPVWSLPWRAEASEPVMLAHPAYPAQQHQFHIYSIDDRTRATRFAACELSNGVWGFYRWIIPADAATGMSGDGSLRYEHDLGPFENGRYDAVTPTARLYDAHTAALLFDGASWTSSRIVPQADGSILLTLECRDRQTIFGIDPPARTFRDLVVLGAVRPLDELMAAADAAQAECNDPANTYIGRRVAPDGSLLVELAAVEWSNTHWVNSPLVIEIATGRVLLDLSGTDWDASVSFPRSRAVRLSFRRYHFGGNAEVEIDLNGEWFALFERSGTRTGGLGQLRDALEKAARDSSALARPRPLLEMPQLTARNWLVALLILVGAMALIAVATAITLHFQKQASPQKLDMIPAMPSG